jgi:hypothetical protein
LVIPAYFLLLMADGRRLKARLRVRRSSYAGDAQEGEIPLITSDYPLWMSHPFIGDEAARRCDDSVLMPAGYESSGPDRI